MRYRRGSGGEEEIQRSPLNLGVGGNCYFSAPCERLYFFRMALYCPFLRIRLNESLAYGGLDRRFVRLANGDAVGQRAIELLAGDLVPAG